jgi:hypothetical protein
LAVIYVDTPSAEVAEVSSSNDLSIFSSGADSWRAEGVGVTLEESSPSIRELWPDIDKLDEIPREGASAVHSSDVVLHDRRLLALAKKIERYRRQGEGSLLSDAPGPSNIRLKGCGKSSTKKKTTQILSVTPEAISPHMRWSFVNRRYSPLTGMGLSEWEVILDELIHMGYIVKKEPDSDGNTWGLRSSLLLLLLLCDIAFVWSCFEITFVWFYCEIAFVRFHYNIAFMWFGYVISLLGNFVVILPSCDSAMWYRLCAILGA